MTYYTDINTRSKHPGGHILSVFAIKKIRQDPPTPKSYHVTRGQRISS